MTPTQREAADYFCHARPNISRVHSAPPQLAHRMQPLITPLIMPVIVSLPLSPVPTPPRARQPEPAQQEPAAGPRINRWDAFRGILSVLLTLIMQAALRAVTGMRIV